VTANDAGRATWAMLIVRDAEPVASAMSLSLRQTGATLQRD